MLKDTKVKCKCGCPTTLYITELEKDVLCIGTEPNARKGFRLFKGAVIEKKELLKLIKP